MIRCKNCGTNNIDGSEYCDECGVKLDLGLYYAESTASDEPRYQPPSAVDSDFGSHTVEGPTPTPPSFTTSTSMPKPAMPAERRVRDAKPNLRIPLKEIEEPLNAQAAGRSSDPPQRASAKTYALSSKGRTDPFQAERQQANGPSSAARLRIERGGRVGREFSISGVETNIGRWDADSGIFPDVDLDEDDPEAKVSRRHARIIRHSGQYFIEDLGSTNGTFVNRGRRLLPGKRHLLQDGDEIIVGKTFLKFQVLRA